MKDKEIEVYEELTEDTFEKWDREWKKEHPIRNWVDKTLFRGHRIGDYSASYALLNPWKLVEDCGREIKWAWQRVFRGWDDRISWSIDYYLDENLPLWLERLIKYKQGVPSDMFKDEDYVEGSPNYELKPEAMEIRSKEFDDILQKIADGFRIHRKLMDLDFDYQSPEWLDAEKQFSEAFDLFKKHYGSLWD